ncbi:glutamate racemase [Candidatus Falkowbacteria bacterium CG10_big_fil_rev_8_21_14_0_10_39_9]|uniref:Glutamate racemase n=1 Tax=Candidatus Falkowbacteria bacterium CG10_big_fil_rev_8_21_14_0_10_39_9 TaxID=1974566 RepID=A0A2M6WQN7_9BACT|nr:MAG: glutamate racemase [Candidatus Falkowbacteria bacterium CG10_big_fil_rev_8_21_14_0_10_39_9]
MIGIFDSGLGGLSVFKYFLKKLPQFNYIYLGDNARVPYGGKSQEVIYEYTKEAIDFLFSQGANLIIIACNTASAEALKKIQQEYLPQKYPHQKVLGVIRPLAEAASQNKKLTRVGVIGTKATISSNVYKTEIKKLNPQIKVFQLSTPLLVPLIEEGWAHKPETKNILKSYLTPLKTKHLDALILGCTHYPFMLSEAKKIMGRSCLVPNTGRIIAQSLKDYLKRHLELELTPVFKPTINFYTTDDVKQFKKVGEKFLGQKITKIKKITL